MYVTTIAFKLHTIYNVFAPSSILKDCNIFSSLMFIDNQLRQRQKTHNGGWTNFIWHFNLFLNLHTINIYPGQYFTFYVALNHQWMVKQKQEWAICIWRMNIVIGRPNKNIGIIFTNVPLLCSGWCPCCDWMGQGKNVTMVMLTLYYVIA